MKQQIQAIFTQAFEQLKEKQIIPEETSVKIQIDRTKDSKHGDFACNLAMMLAKPARRKPRELAEEIVSALPESTFIAKVEIAGPGFINVFLQNNAYQAVVSQILEQTTAYGQSTLGKDESILVEFVSANPTGPLHVGHGRGAAYGAALSNLLETAGYTVHREYYVNDAGRQMNILGTSIWLRYLM